MLTAFIALISFYSASLSKSSSAKLGWRTLCCYAYLLTTNCFALFFKQNPIIGTSGLASYNSRAFVAVNCAGCLHSQGQ